MIAQLRGTIVHIGTQMVIVDVQGVGYAVYVSGRTQNQLNAVSGDVTILTEMQVREDSMTLFGFADAAERDAFRLLITVQGVGAKAAMAILSVLDRDALTQAIVAGDKAMVARADGVGPKIAQRVVNELSEKIGKIPSLGGTALCAENGGKWQLSIFQNFDNIYMSMLTLFEISTTEGWTAVMYAATDSRGFHK